MPVHLKQFTRCPNVGDVASSYIVSKILDVDLTLCGEERLDCPNLIAVGSILHWADRNSMIWGTGFLSADIGLPAVPARVLAVRGHLTRERLLHMGISVPGCVGDPGS